MTFDFDPVLVSDLSDSDLRSLVARLCESERCANGGHITDVLWGGAQTAPDGGLDVAVRGAALAAGQPLIGLAEVGIQVKKASMSASDIGAEMRPGGALRPVISRIAAAGGAYVIVSGGDTCQATPCLTSYGDTHRYEVGRDDSGRRGRADRESQSAPSTAAGHRGAGAGVQALKASSRSRRR
jgi:hypothetical protein